MPNLENYEKGISEIKTSQKSYYEFSENPQFDNVKKNTQRKEFLKKGQKYDPMKSIKQGKIKYLIIF